MTSTALGLTPSQDQESERTPFGGMLHVLQVKYAAEGVTTHHGAVQWVVWPIEQMFADALPLVLQAMGGVIRVELKTLVSATRIAAFADRRLNAGILLLHGSPEAAAQAFEHQVIGAMQRALRLGFRPGMTLSKDAWLGLSRGNDTMARAELRGKRAPAVETASTLWAMPTYLFLAACLRKAREVYEQASELMGRVIRLHRIASAKVHGQERFQDSVAHFFLLEGSEIRDPEDLLLFLGTREDDEGVPFRTYKEAPVLLEHLETLVRLAAMGRKIIEANVRLHPELPTSMHMGLLTMWIHTEAVRIVLPDAPTVLRPFEVVAGLEQVPQHSIDDMTAAVLARAQEKVSMDSEDAELLRARIRTSLWLKFYARPRTPGLPMYGNDCDEFIADVYSDTQETPFDEETAVNIAIASVPIPSGIEDHRAFLEHRVLPALKYQPLIEHGLHRDDNLLGLATGPIPFDLMIAWVRANVPKKDQAMVAHHLLQRDRRKALPLLLEAGITKMSDYILTQYPECVPSATLLAYLRKRMSKTMLVDVKAGILRAMAHMDEADFQALWREEKITTDLLELFSWTLSAATEVSLPRRISWDEVRAFTARFNEPTRVLLTTATVAEARASLYADVEDMDATDAFEPPWEEIPRHPKSRSYELFSRVFEPAMIARICADDREVTAFEFTLGKNRRTPEFLAQFVQQREIYRARAASFGK